jgi:LysM repeat protein
MRIFNGVVLGLFAVFAPMATSAQTSSITCGETYTVAPGDTLSKISTNAYGVSAFGVLVEANEEALGGNPNLLFVGQKLVIPCRDQAPSVQASASQAPDTKPAPSAPPSSGKVVLTFNKTSDPRFVINSGIVDPYLERIAEATEGRVTLIDPPVMNRDPSAQLELVASGQVDAAYVLNQHLADSHPLLQIPMIPLMGGSAEQTAVSLWNLHENYLSKTDYFNQAHLLGFISAPAAHIWHRIDDPVVAGENILTRNAYPEPYFKGLDMIGPKRVQEQNAATFGRTGMNADGPLTFMMAHGAARGGGIWNSAIGVTEVENGIYTPTLSVVLSNEAWARISPEDRDIINILSGALLARRSAAWDTFDNGHRQVMLDTDLAVAYPDGPLLKELEEAAQTELAQWSGHAADLGIPATQAIAAYRADLASLRYLLIFR